MNIGSILGGAYEIEAELGRGTSGIVYAARRIATGRRVALKVLDVSSVTSARERATIIARFEQERCLAAQLSHPNIVPILDVGKTADDVPFVVFEHVVGRTLRQVLEAEGRLSITETASLMSEVLDALACAHRNQVVHRDLKPENIMVSHSGVRRRAHILDFGAGGLVASVDVDPNHDGANVIVGTPCYAAPEQLCGQAASSRADIYSWGLIFIECISGTAAISGASAREAMDKQWDPAPIPLPPALEQHPIAAYLRTAIAKQVERRSVCVEDLMAALSAVATGNGSVRRVEPAAAAGERRQLTIVSCRFSVANEIETGVDAEDIDLALHARLQRCAAVAARCGGQVASIMANRAMLTFGYPAAREDDVRRALRAAQLIAADAGREPAASAPARLATHVGIHTGPVVVRGNPSAEGVLRLGGITAQLATAVEMAASAGEVLLSVDTRQALRDAVVTEPAGVVHGLRQSVTVPVLRLISVPRTVPTTEPVAEAEAPLVGRARELDVLLQAWDGTLSGRPGATLVQGEAGIGKSRLIRELRRQISPFGWLECRCVPENQDTTLAPVIDLLSGRDEPIEALLERHGFVLAQTMPLLAPLLFRAADPAYPPLGLSAERQKEQTLTLLVQLVLAMAAHQPTALAVEDLQWADPTTLELVDLLVARLRAADTVETAPTVMLLLVARPEFQPRWSSDDVSMVSLSRLSDRDVAAMITTRVSTGAAVPAEVIDEVVRRGDGIPLFVEEISRLLIEQGPQVRELPGTLRDLLAARLDGLSASARETAQLAAVLGRDFRHGVLRAVSDKEDVELRENVRELCAAGLISHRRTVQPETYVFRHALLRDAAYASLVRSVRGPLHHRVATMLRDRFPDLEQHRPEMLGYHFERAGDVDAAMDYIHRAASRALHRAAYAEAHALLQRALALAHNGENGIDRTRREIELLATLGAVQVSTIGYSTVEVEQTFARAWELSGTLGQTVPSSVLYGLWGVHITRSSRAGTDALIPHLHQIAERSDDPVAALTASACLGTAHYWSAEFETSHRYLSQGRRLFDTDAFQRYAQAFGYGVGLYSHAFGQLTLWMLGCPDQAAVVRGELLAIGERVRDPYCLAVALAFGMTLAHDRDEPQVELDLANRLITLADEQRLPVWLAIGQIGRGGAYTRMGGAREGIPSIQQGLQTLQTVGVWCSYNYFLTYLAEAHLDAGDFDIAATILDESAALCGTLVSRAHEPELSRLRGELILRRDGIAADAGVGAAACFANALGHARATSCKSYELRASIGLARVWCEAGQQVAAYELLAPVVGWFSEGQETPDLRAAREVLASIAM